jgi:hypothetical protein
MTDNTNMFEAVDQQEVQTGEQEALVQLVGEGKKFKDHEALAKAKLESDMFIKKIQDENAKLREELDERLKVSKVLEEIKKGSGNHSGDADKADANQHLLDEDKINTLVEKKLNETVQKNTAKQNVLEADRLIVEKLGSREAALKFITEKAKDMGVDGAWLMNVASTNPKALYAVLGLNDLTDKKQDTQTVAKQTSSVNTSQREYAPTGGNMKPGTKEYFDNIRKTNPSLYYKPEIQNEIFAAAKKGTYKV